MTPRIPLIRLPVTCLAVALTLVVAAGCATPYQADWSNVPERKEPKVNLVRYAHVVHFPVDSAKLEGSERTLLDDFLAKVQANSNDKVAVVGSGGDTALASRRRDVVMAYLTLRAIPSRVGPGGLEVGGAGADTVSVIVRRYSVTLPACPDWSGDSARTWNNTVSRNWGCATATNLGLMVADPADLVAGRAPGPMDGQAAVLAIQRYRTGKTTPLATDNTTTSTQQTTGTGSGASGSSSSGGSQ